MTLFSVKQSLPLSVLFAFLSGLFLTLATASTYIPAHIDIVASRWLEEEEKEKKKEQENDGNDANKNNNNKKNEESFIDNIIMEESQQQDDDEEHQTRTKAAPPRRHPKKVSKRMWKIVRTYTAAVRYCSCYNYTLDALLLVLLVFRSAAALLMFTCASS
jgi:hypothetical protein